MSEPSATLGLSRDDLTLLLHILTVHSTLLGDERLAGVGMRLIHAWGQMDDEARRHNRDHTRDLGRRIVSVLSDHCTETES